MNSFVFGQEVPADPWLSRSGGERGVLPSPGNRASVLLAVEFRPCANGLGSEEGPRGRPDPGTPV